MSKSNDELQLAIGRAVYEWSQLEHAVAILVLDLSIAVSEGKCVEQKGIDVFNTMMANTELKQHIPIAKALAHQTGSENMLRSVDETLNYVGTTLRNDRNRFVHDIWSVNAEKVTRIRRGTALIKQPPSGKRKLMHTRQTEYRNIEEVGKFADKIAEYRSKVLSLSEMAQGLRAQPAHQ